MVQTRSASSSPVKKTVAPSQKIITQSLEAPLHLLIAPKGLTEASRFVSLPNPANNETQKFLFSPDEGLFEIKKISCPRADPRSILFAQRDGEDAEKEGDFAGVSRGYINKNAEYMTATPYDMCFILLPVTTNSGKNDLFQSLEDLLDASGVGEHTRYVLQHSRIIVEDALSNICDMVEAGDERLYRYNQEKTLKLLVTKARKACGNGLPVSLEDKFVTRALETPVLSVKREETTISVAKADDHDGAETPSTPSESLGSQSSAASAAPSVIFSEASIVSTTTTIAEETVSPAIKDLQRLRTAFKFIVYSYCSPVCARNMEEALNSSASEIDFKPLNDHLGHLQKLRAEAAASHSLSDFSRKRGSLEDEEEAEFRAEKKRKLEEEEKKKKLGLSRGVRELGKVNVAGMKKMSDFFSKKPAAGKAKK
ncbi:hypothetical protein H2198_004500 [Neophaeococcomyces mojaviensis]|uniref:Uncharacterized protein n=1 Tax=Neophaeococcomyces mojaviensis TaxID=3383035 RepID=A0ACC3A965_9EURO|nr:hypothetical protein H2198_004500 [Knufia sp. JES_112]